MTNLDIYNIYEGICELSQYKFNAITSFTLAKNKIVLEPYYNAIKACERDIWLQFGVEQPDGSITMPNENVGKANKALDELMRLEVDVKVDKIKLKDLESVECSIDLFEKLIKIIKEAQE